MTSTTSALLLSSIDNYKKIINKYAPKLKNENLLKSIYENIYKSYNDTYYFLHSMTKEEIINKNSILKPVKFGDGGFPPEILSHINKKSKYNITFVYDLLHSTITIHFIVENSNPNMEIYKKHCLKIIAIISFFQMYALRKNCFKTDISIYIYMTSLLKERNSEGLLNQFNVNTGFTTNCSPEIVIYREEEWFKVLIHELMHNFNLDFSNYTNDSEIKTKVKQIFHINQEILLFESYSEFWGEILNSAFLAYNIIVYRSKFFNHSHYSSLKTSRRNFNQYSQNYTTFINLFYDIYKQELFFKIIQMIKVLKIKKLTYYSITNLDCSFYKEDTNIISYFIITTILLFHFEDFIVWCNKHNLNTIQFKISSKNNILEFCNFIIVTYKSKPFLNYIKIIEKIFNEDIVKNNKSFINKTLRMTIFG
jgi:hypothetical protein